MAVLPFELFRQIVVEIGDDVDDPTYSQRLSAISLSCRLLRPEAQRVLFRNSGELHTTIAVHNKTILFMNAVTSSPDRLALYVKAFTITFDHWSRPNAETPAFVQKLSDTLRPMRNLESLKVTQWTPNVRSLPDILQDVHSKLTSFTWLGYPDSASTAADSKTDFLRRQDNIKHLVVSEFIDERTLDTIAVEICPLLRSLSAPNSLSAIILPGKQHITSLQWVLPLKNNSATDHLPGNPVERISQELQRIKYISYNCSGSTFPVGPDINQMAPYLINLVCLETRRDNAVQWEVLSRLPRLEVLILNADSGFADPPAVDEIIWVVTQSRSLEWVDIEDNYGRFSRIEYCRSGKTSRIYDIDKCDRYIWIDDFDIFGD